MRHLTPHVYEDLQTKMVFLGGPRQVGKTTLAQDLIQIYKTKHKKTGLYFNWDDSEQKKEILARRWHDDDKLLVFDELHKYPRWKNWIKGLYDTQKSKHHFLVTGSAKLDVFRRGGDSLLGRYHYWRLHPFTLAELPPKIKPADAFARLMKVGGFPEPFLANSERFARRWRRDRLDRVLKDDVRDLEPIRNIALLDLLVDALRTRVGGLISTSNLAQDLQVNFNTIQHWLEILERMYLIFIVRPFTRGLTRSIQKPFKVYFFDNADVIGDEGAIYENLVATHLLKALHFSEDYHGYRHELCFVRDKEGHEVDFAIVRDGKLVELIEAKWSDEKIAGGLSYFAEKLKPSKARQIVAHIQRPYSRGQLHVESAVDSLRQILK